MLIMGAPGSGKGTQSEILAEQLQIPTISTGAMLRAAIAEGTEVGKKAEQYINDGKLVPDQVMIQLVLDRVSRDDCKNGYILDGFPRTLAQAEAMADAGIAIDCALLIDVPDAVIMDRLSGRRVCRDCGATYHIQNKPSAKGDLCEQCGAALTIREDDVPDTIANRLRVYHEITEPVTAYYGDQGKLKVVTATNSIAETTELVLKALGR